MQSKEESTNNTGKSNKKIYSCSDFKITNVTHKQSKNELRSESRFGSNTVPECFTIRYSPNDNYLAAGYSNGTIRLFEVNKEMKLHILIKVSTFAVTAIRFKGAESMLMCTTADGKVSTYHTASGKLLYQFQEKDNPLMCLDVNPFSSLFAVGGHDKVVKLYDDETKTLIKELHGNYQHVGHSNRIFAVNFHKTEYNMLVSGGWDSIVTFYDIRQKSVVGNCLGAHICGDALDMRGNYVITGSHSAKEQIKIFDIRTRKLVEKIKWEYEENSHTSGLYCAQFSKQASSFKNTYIAVGGSNVNQFRMWNYDDNEKRNENYCCEEFQLFEISMSTDIQKNVENNNGDREIEKETQKVQVSEGGGSVYCLDFCNKWRNTISLACGDGFIRTYEIKEKS